LRRSVASPAVDTAPSRRRTTVAGLAGFLALFAGLCTVFALLATVWDWREEAAQARWPVVSALIASGEVDPQRLSHGATGWQLRYRVRYEAEGQERVARLASRLERSEDEPAALRAFASKHRRGGHIDVRYDPEQPGHAIFASADVPNTGPRTTADLQLLLIAATLCVGLLALARHLQSQDQDFVLATDGGRATPGGRIALGIVVAAFGLLMIGLGLHAALRATHPLTSEDFIGVFAAMVFVLGGVLLALPPERGGLQKLLGALLMTTFAVTLDWIAFGPGPRRFGGGLSNGWLGVGFATGETFGRTVFGIFAVILDIFAALMWFRLIRRSPGSPRPV
jgi:Protein of unknown function (DUF3592)